MMLRQRIGPIIARWTTELLVVFVGVYGAFAVAEWDEAREREQRAAQLRSALAEEVRGVQANTHRVAEIMPLYVGRLDSLMAAGVAFRPEPQMEAIGFRTHVWEASLASGALSLLDFDAFYRASMFYNELNAGFQQIEQLADLSTALLLPAAEAPPASFFEPDAAGSGLRLRPQYRWYVTGLRRLGRLARCVTVLGDTLLVELGAAPDTARAALDPEGC